MSIDELVADYCTKNGLNPDDFDIPGDVFNPDQGGDDFERYMKTMEPLISILLLLL